MHAAHFSVGETCKTHGHVVVFVVTPEIENEVYVLIVYDLLSCTIVETSTSLVAFWG